jgi:NAD(P)H-hydrate epimerase
MVVGPGLGEGTKSRALVERLLVRWRGPVVLDADALNVFAGEPRTLGTLLAGRPAVVTPHPAEAARLLRCDVSAVLADREGSARELARMLGATVLLKGPPTVIAASDGALAVSASGSPVLGTAGSGDLLAGVVGTLLAQTLDAFHAAQVAAWVHGRAGELAAVAVSTRGASLDDVVAALGQVWGEGTSPHDADVLATLPAVGRAP